MSEKYIQANGLRLAYDEFGDAANPSIILIMGLGTQMIAWPVPFCEGLADHGFHVVRFDNRDIGLSEKMSEAKKPKFARMILFQKMRIPYQVPYTLKDMATDAVGLMDALNIDKAHVVGASMGGMIAQLVAVHFPERVLSLTSIMSTSGNPRYSRPKPEVLKVMAKRVRAAGKFDLDGAVEFWRLIESPDYRMTDEVIKSKVLTSYNRSNHPDGYSRHIAAIIHGGSRVKLLEKITSPALVIHGKSDVLVPVEGGTDTARHIKGAKLELIDGMGHNLPGPLLPKLIELITAHALASTPTNAA